MTRMTGPDRAVMCNLINTHTHTHTHTQSVESEPRSFAPAITAILEYVTGFLFLTNAPLDSLFNQ